MTTRNIDRWDREAHLAYDVLVAECGASEKWRHDFVLHVAQWLHDGQPNEYRFQGDLGFGGKLYVVSDGSSGSRLRVGYYPEDQNIQRDAARDAANAEFDGMFRTIPTAAAVERKRVPVATSKHHGQEPSHD